MDATRNELYVRNPNTARYGRETISFLSPKFWALIPQNMEDSNASNVLKRVLENRNVTVHVANPKHFCSMLVLFAPQ